MPDPRMTIGCLFLIAEESVPIKHRETFRSASVLGAALGMAEVTNLNIPEVDVLLWLGDVDIILEELVLNLRKEKLLDEIVTK